jgi:hypothetical protein
MRSGAETAVTLNPNLAAAAQYEICAWLVSNKGDGIQPSKLCRHIFSEFFGPRFGGERFHIEPSGSCLWRLPCVYGCGQKTAPEEK